MDFTPDMARSIIFTSNAPAAIGTYSQAVRAGDTLYLSGKIGLDPQTGQLGNGIDNQIDRVFRNLEAVAEAAGGSLADSVKLTVYLTDLSHFARVNEIMARYFDKPYPARAAVGVAALPRGALVEADAILVLGSRESGVESKEPGRAPSFVRSPRRCRRPQHPALDSQPGGSSEARAPRNSPRSRSRSSFAPALRGRDTHHPDRERPARLARAGGRHGAFDRDRLPAAAPADLADRGSDGRDRASLLQLLCEPGEGARPRRDGARLRRGARGVFRRRDDPSALLRAARGGAAA